MPNSWAMRSTSYSPQQANPVRREFARQFCHHCLIPSNICRGPARESKIGHLFLLFAIYWRNITYDKFIIQRAGALIQINDPPSADDCVAISMGSIERQIDIYQNTWAARGR